MNLSFSIISDLKQLRDYFCSRIRELLAVDKVFIFLLHSDTNKYMLLNEAENEPCQHEKYIFSPSDKLIFWLSVNKTFINFDENPDVVSFITEHERQMLEKMKVTMAYPFVVMNKVKGLMLIGKKTDGSQFEKNDFSNLAIILDQAGFAFESAYSYQLQQERTRKMYRADRLATLGELAAGAAHEIRNPLTSIRSSIQFLKRKLPEASDQEMANSLIDEVDRINSILEAMLSFARPQEPKKEQFNLKQLLLQLLQLTINTARKKNIAVQFLFNTENEIIEADSNQLKQAFLNILMNAFQSIEHNNGKIDITIDQIKITRYTGKTEYLYLIQIADNGSGIDSENLERIFDPFYTTKEDGTGLGLSITYGIITRHNGEIEINSEVNKGTVVKIKIPVS
jgi:signal transduction histidine kinase